jgi:hypothetical protein
LRGVLRSQEEISVEIYNTFGFKPFTLKELYKAVGNTRFKGCIIHQMKNNKCVCVIDKEIYPKERKVVTTYRLTMDMINYMKKKGLVE